MIWWPIYRHLQNHNPVGFRVLIYYGDANLSPNRKPIRLRHTQG